MKKKVFISALFMALILSVNAQKLRLNLYGGYVFDDSFDSYYDYNAYSGYQGKIKGGFQWGAGLEYMLQPSYGLEVYYLRQDTKAPAQYFTSNILQGYEETEFEVAINYIMIGGNRYILSNPKINPFFGLSLGACILDVKNPDKGTEESVTKFAWGLRGGALFNASEKIGIKLMASLMSAVQGAGGGVYFGTGGVGTGVSTYSSMYQFGLGAGLVIKFQQKAQQPQ